MQIALRHTTRYRYEPEALRLALRVTLYPVAHDGLQIDAWSVTADGEPVDRLLTDAAGNGVGLWHRHEASDGVEITAEGQVRTADTAGVFRGHGERMAPGIWLRRTGLTRADEAIRALADETTGTGPLDRLHALSAAVHEAIDYRRGATDAGTTAAEAMALGAGVCQDQSHVFIAAARHLGMPARYVIGYLMTAEIEDARVPPTETHAWAEAHVPGLGWTGFDPTHLLCPTPAYVRLGCGFDARDAAPIRGNVLGETDETLDVEVSIAQASGQSQQ